MGDERKPNSWTHRVGAVHRVQWLALIGNTTKYSRSHQHKDEPNLVALGQVVDRSWKFFGSYCPTFRMQTSWIPSSIPTVLFLYLFKHLLLHTIKKKNWQILVALLQCHAGLNFQLKISTLPQVDWASELIKFKWCITANSKPCFNEIQWELFKIFFQQTNRNTK